MAILSADMLRHKGTQPIQPEPMHAAEETLKLLSIKEDVRGILLCDLADVPSGGMAPTMLQLIVLEGESITSIVSIPVRTRALVNRLDTEGNALSVRYATLQDAYIEGDAIGKGYENLLASISQLFGGVPIRSIISVAAPGMEAFVERLGGIRVRYDYYSAAAGGVVSGGIVGTPYASGSRVDMRGAQVLEYAASSLQGFAYDVGAMRRQQEVFFGICERLDAMREPYTLDMFASDTGGWMHAALTTLEEENLYHAMAALAEDEDREGLAQTLWGEERVIDGIVYCLPDTKRIKQFVLDAFYESPTVQGAMWSMEEEMG